MGDYQNYLRDCEKIIKDGEWEQNFRNYLNNVKNMEAVDDNISRINSDANCPLGIYTSVSKAANSAYDIRYQGQNVAAVESGKVRFNENLAKYFDDIPSFGDFTPIEAIENLSKMKIKDGKKLHSPEHLVESHVLKYMNLDAEKKYLKHMRPVTIKNLFFQMPTFFSASNHGGEVFRKDGGGIDVLARIKVADESPKDENHLCIMELKDSITSGEEPNVIIKQAIAYACCIQKLLRSNQGQEWYDLFRGQEDTKSIPSPLVLYACVVVPFGKGLVKGNLPDGYKRNGEISFANGDKLRLRYLYLDMSDDYTEIVGEPETNLNLKE